MVNGVIVVGVSNQYRRGMVKYVHDKFICYLYHHM